VQQRQPRPQSASAASAASSELPKERQVHAAPPHLQPYLAATFSCALPPILLCSPPLQAEASVAAGGQARPASAAVFG
jgi:hypothetical protein